MPGVCRDVLRSRRLPPHVLLFEVEPRGAHEDPHCQVVDARLQDVDRVLGHLLLPVSLMCSTSFDLYSLRRRLPHGTSSTCVSTTRTLRSRPRIASASAASAARPCASSTLTGSGG